MSCQERETFLDAIADEIEARAEGRMIQLPIGQVAIFGVSNFPLAAGCAVVVKGQSAHRVTGEINTDAIRAAIAKCGMPPALLHETGFERTSPCPDTLINTGSVTGMPKAV